MFCPLFTAAHLPSTSLVTVSVVTSPVPGFGTGLVASARSVPPGSGGNALPSGAGVHDGADSFSA